MSAESNERRRHKRILFSIAQKITGQFTVSGGSLNSPKPLNVPILDISEGGVGFVLDSTHGKNVGINDQLILNHLVVGADDPENILPLTLDLPVTVRGKIAADFFRHVGVGCDFTQISQDDWNTIRSFIQAAFPGKMP